MERPARHSHLLISLSVLIPFLLFASAPTASGAEPTVSFYTDKNKPLCTYRVELAKTPQQQEQGLMYRTRLSPDAGMLFVYRDDVPKYFWMKNTLIPLDIIYISSKLTVAEIFRNARPLDETIIASTKGARYVLEVNAGQADRCSIYPGAKVRFQGVSR